MDSACRSLEPAAFSVLWWQESGDPKQQAAPKRCPAQQVLMESCQVPRVSPERWLARQVWLERPWARRASPAEQREQPPVLPQARRPQAARQLQQELVLPAAPLLEPRA